MICGRFISAGGTRCSRRGDVAMTYCGSIDSVSECSNPDVVLCIHGRCLLAVDFPHHEVGQRPLFIFAI